MKIAILILLSNFILISQVFADDGVKDPVGMTGCIANKNLNVFKNSGDKKILKKINCKDILRWSSTVEFDSKSVDVMELFVFEAKKIDNFWWLKIKPIKENDFVWIAITADHGKPELVDNSYIEQETEMSEKWDGKIYPNPEFKSPKAAQKYTNAIYKELKTVDGRLWVRVEIIASECAPAEERPVLAAGWVPFMHSNTESNFYSEQDCTP